MILENLVDLVILVNLMILVNLVMSNKIYLYIRTNYVKNVVKDTPKQCFGAILIFGVNIFKTKTPLLSMSEFQWRKYLLR